MFRKAFLIVMLLFLAACKDDKVSLDHPSPTSKDPSGQKAAAPKAPDAGEIPCEALFTSHGHCFVPATQKVYNVPRGTSPMKGGEHPLVTIVEFTDFQCPACKDFALERIPEILKKYGKDVGIVLKHYPLSFHPMALTMSQAAEEVRAQKGEAAFWKFHDVMYKGSEAPLTATWIRSQAEAMGLDMNKYDAALKKGTHKTAISRDMQLGREVELEGTPWIFVNGTLARRKSVDVMVSEALSEAKKAVEAGTPREKIYGFLTDHGKLFHERKLDSQTHKTELEKFKTGFLSKCNKSARDFQTFYGVVYGCSKQQTKCKPFMDCIQKTIYGKK